MKTPQILPYWAVQFLGSTTGCFDLLPNQKSRQIYQSTEKIDCGVEDLDTYARKQQSDKWLLSIKSKFPSTENVVWIQSKSPFHANYETFEVELGISNPFKVRGVVPFLFAQETATTLPMYKQISARKRDNSNEWILTLTKPNEGDQIVVIAFVSGFPSKNKTVPANASLKPLL